MVKTTKKTPIKKAPAKKSKSNSSRKTKVDWLEVRKEYLMDATTSYKSLAKKYGVALKTLQDRGTREGWSVLRQDLVDKAFNRFTEKLLDQKSSANERHLQHWQNLQGLANEAVVDMATRNFERDRKGNLVMFRGKPLPVPLNTFELEKLAKTLKIAIDGERVVLGIPTSVSALSNPDGDDIFTGLADLIKGADEVLKANGETVE